MARLWQSGLDSDRDYRSGSGCVPNLHDAQHPALVDTGATLSCIDSVLAATLHLPIVDRESVSGVHGSQEVNVHLAQIHIPSLDCVIIGRFHGIHLVQGNQPHLALLGRVFLRNFTMTYDGRAGSVKIGEERRRYAIRGAMTTDTRKPTPRSRGSADELQTSRSELDEDMRVEATFEEVVQALALSVKVRYIPRPKLRR